MYVSQHFSRGSLGTRLHFSTVNYFFLHTLLTQGVSQLAVNVSANAVSPTVISVKWDFLRACNQSSDQVTYRVRYTAESSGEEELSATRVASLTGLTPFTNYSIQIATVNEHEGVGLYSSPIKIQTPEDGNSFK